MQVRVTLEYWHWKSTEYELRVLMKHDFLFYANFEIFIFKYGNHLGARLFFDCIASNHHFWLQNKASEFKKWQFKK